MNENVCVFVGGAVSNMYSVMVARYKHYPEVKIKGMAAVPRLVLFTSEHVCHLFSLWQTVYLYIPASVFPVIEIELQKGLLCDPWISNGIFF